MSKFGRRLLIGVAALCASFATVANTQVTRSGNGYLLRVKNVKGLTLKYRLTSETTDATDPKQTQKMTAPWKTTVLSVANGVATIKFDSGPFMLNGKPLANTTNSAEVKMDSRGKLTGGTAAATQLSGVQLPEKPIRVGESFDFTNTVPLGQTPMTAKWHCTLAGFKSINARQAAEIKTTMSSSGFIPVTGKGIQYIEVADGQLVSAQMDLQVNMAANGVPTKINSKIKIDRLGAP